MRRRRNLLGLAAVFAAMAIIATGSLPAAADPDAGFAKGATALSPDLKGHYTLDPDTGEKVESGADDGFPCGDAALPVLDALSKYASGEAFDVNEYPCFGSLFDGGVPVINNIATLVTSGRDSDSGTPFAFQGRGTVAAAYTYSEPCNGGRSTTGEAIGTLTLTLSTGSGIVGTTPITSATYKTTFWWSRVGVTAVVGLKGGTLISSAGTVSDAQGRGLAVALFVPKSAPDCVNVHDPVAGDISIFSGSLGVG